MMNVLSASEPINVCCLDWSAVTQCSYISNAKFFVYRIADYLASIISFVRDTIGIALNRFVLIGHGFGAHMIGMAGKRFPPPNQLPLGIGEYIYKCSD